MPVGRSWNPAIGFPGHRDFFWKLSRDSKPDLKWAHLIPFPELYTTERGEPVRARSGRLCITRRRRKLCRRNNWPRRGYGQRHLTLRGSRQELRPRRRLAGQSLRELCPKRAVVLDRDRPAQLALN